jgi:hypothetical protein
VAKRFDILVGQQLCQLVATLKRQNGGDRVQRFGAFFD